MQQSFLSKKTFARARLELPDPENFLSINRSATTPPHRPGLKCRSHSTGQEYRSPGFANTPNLVYLRQNCSDDSTEVTEGVTSTPEIFGNKQGATSTPEICGNKHSFVLTFFTSNTIHVNCKRCKP